MADNKGCRPLYYAAKSGNTKVVKLLLEAGSDLHARDPTDDARQTDGFGSLKVAIAFNHPEVVATLLEERHKCPRTISRKQ